MTFGGCTYLFLEEISWPSASLAWLIRHSKIRFPPFAPTAKHVHSPLHLLRSCRTVPASWSTFRLHLKSIRQFAVICARNKRNICISGWQSVNLNRFTYGIGAWSDCSDERVRPCKFTCIDGKIFGELFSNKLSVSASISASVANGVSVFKLLLLFLWLLLLLFECPPDWMFVIDFDVGNEYDGRWVVVAERLGKLPPRWPIFDQTLCGVEWCDPWLKFPWLDQSCAGGLLGVPGLWVTGRLWSLRLGGDNAGNSSLWCGFEVVGVVGGVDEMVRTGKLLPPFGVRTFSDGDAGTIFGCGNETTGVLATDPYDDCMVVAGFCGRIVVVVPEFLEKIFLNPLKKPVDFGVVGASVCVIGTV